MKLNKLESNVMIKAVLDTNIFVSSLIGSGNPYLILKSFGDKEFNLIISNALVDELLDVLTRTRFQKYFTYHDIKELAFLIQSSAQITSPIIKIQICRDPKDNIVLECAVAGEVDFIVTGDDDLLCLNPYQNIRIITPAHFLKTLKAV